MRSLILRFILAALAWLPLAAAADYVYNTINYPGAVFTDVRAINNRSGQTGPPARSQTVRKGVEMAN